MTSPSRIRGLLLAAAAFLAFNGAAQAAGTVAGTSITNTATVNYSVGGSAQSPVTSNTASFLVDRKINLSVTEVGGSATVVSYGNTAQVTTFQVTNLTNATQDFNLSYAQQASLGVTVFGLTDNMNVSNVHIYVDANGNGLYDAGTDTATYIDELAPDLSKTVFIVADIPVSGPTNGVSGIALIATAATGGTSGSLGADVAATVGLDSPTTIDVVFADPAGAVDLVRDGSVSAYDSYVTATTTITFAKSAIIISDPVNLSTAPKAIPGAVVEYCLKVSNTGLGTATAVSISDAVPSNTTYVPGSLYVGGTTLSGECVLDGTAEDDNATGADETDLNGGSSDGATVLATIPTILPSTTATARFRVTLN